MRLSDEFYNHLLRMKGDCLDSALRCDAHSVELREMLTESEASAGRYRKQAEQWQKILDECEGPNFEVPNPAPLHA